MREPDPYQPEPPFEYECSDCGERVQADRQPVECEVCGGDMQDVSLPRE